MPDILQKRDLLTNEITSKKNELKNLILKESFTFPWSDPPVPDLLL